jgi:hypothetical protein
MQADPDPDPAPVPTRAAERIVTVSKISRKRKRQ